MRQLVVIEHPPATALVATQRADASVGDVVIVGYPHRQAASARAHHAHRGAVAKVLETVVYKDHPQLDPGRDLDRVPGAPAASAAS
jgi:hypothetical protein